MPEYVVADGLDGQRVFLDLDGPGVFLLRDHRPAGMGRMFCEAVVNRPGSERWFLILNGRPSYQRREHFEQWRTARECKPLDLCAFLVASGIDLPGPLATIVAQQVATVRQSPPSGTPPRAGAEAGATAGDGCAATPALRPTVAQNLDSRAVVIAHEMLTAGKGINVSEVARLLGCERTRLYHMPTFRAFVRHERACREAAKRRLPRGTKDRETRSVEGWDEDV